MSRPLRLIRSAEKSCSFGECRRSPVCTSLNCPEKSTAFQFGAPLPEVESADDKLARRVVMAVVAIFAALILAVVLA